MSNVCALHLAAVTGPTEPWPGEPVFEVNGCDFSKSDMLRDNADDLDFCDWVETAQIGEVFPAFVDCRRKS